MYLIELGEVFERIRHHDVVIHPFQSEQSYYYRGQPRDDGPLREALRQAAQQRRRYGYRRLSWRLRRQGWTDNHKRIERIYREEKLQVRRRARKRLTRLARQPMEPATAINQRWSMDFMADSLADGRRIRFLNIVDDYSRECLQIEADTSLPGARVVRVLEQLRQQRGCPRQLVIDNGPELTGRALDQWAYPPTQRCERRDNPDCRAEGS